MNSCTNNSFVRCHVAYFLFSVQIQLYKQIAGRTVILTYSHPFSLQFYLLRGNHEVAFINRNYGFYQELSERFCDTVAESLWSAFNDVFDLLPLAALVHGRILCMHGGISPLLNSFDDIRNVSYHNNSNSISVLIDNVIVSIPSKNFSSSVFPNLHGTCKPHYC